MDFSTSSHQDSGDFPINFTVDAHTSNPDGLTQNSQDCVRWTRETKEISKNAFVDHARNGILVAKTHGREAVRDSQTAVFIAWIVGWSPLAAQAFGNIQETRKSTSISWSMTRNVHLLVVDDLHHPLHALQTLDSTRHKRHTHRTAPVGQGKSSILTTPHHEISRACARARARGVSGGG